MNEIKITAVAPTGEAASKGMTVRGHGFVLPVVYTLEDNQSIRSRVTAERKKDLPDALDREKWAISVGAMAAIFNDEGKFSGTHCQWTTGTRPDGKFGLVPVPLKEAV